MEKNHEEFFSNTSGYSHLDVYEDEGFKGSDDNCISDLNQLEAFGIYNKNATYSFWLASRDVNYSEMDVSGTHYEYGRFRIKFNYNGKIGWAWTIFEPYNTGTLNCYDYTQGFRPVFLIKKNVKIKSGTGTYADPYILEAGE